MSPVHNRLDIEHWVVELSLRSLRARVRATVEQWAKEQPRRYRDDAAKHEHMRALEPGAEMVYGPRQIAVIEQLRAESGAARGRKVPIDVCVWGVGSPANPAATKIGGRPYRPTNAPWPRGPDGEPLGLLAQFCFADSRDVMPCSTPGDILLFFAAGPGLYVDWYSDWAGTYALEWHSLDATYRPPAEVPRVLDLTETYAELHRTCDYPESEIDDGLNVIEGSKFGGVPAFQQGDPGLEGCHICTLGSLNPFGNPWPMLNVQVNPKGEQYLDHKLLMLGDLGAVYIFLDRHGTTHWAADCG